MLISASEIVVRLQALSKMPNLLLLPVLVRRSYRSNARCAAENSGSGHEGCKVEKCKLLEKPLTPKGNQEREGATALEKFSCTDAVTAATGFHEAIKRLFFPSFHSHGF
jgi:hypothetical protein